MRDGRAAMEFIDYYAELGVPRGAAQPEVQKAYRRLARKYHPDVNKDPGAEDRFKRVAEAYEVLGDPDKRRQYDQYGAAWKAAQQGGPTPPGFEGFDLSGMGGAGGPTGDFSDFFETFFGRQAPGGRAPGARARAQGDRFRAQQAPLRGKDTEATFELAVEDAYKGGRREVTLTDPRTQIARKFVVTVPAGVRSGQKIRLKGQGGVGRNGGEPGDLLLVVKVIDSERFRLRDEAVHTDLPVSPWVAALGGEARLTTLDGAVTVTVPPGSSSGRKIRLRGKGYPKKSGAGDLYAEIRIVLPRELSPKERELFEALRAASRFVPE
jgi:curved DNA-binding protein